MCCPVLPSPAGSRMNIIAFVLGRSKSCMTTENLEKIGMFH